MKSASLHEYNVSYRIREACALLNAEASTSFMFTHSEESISVHAQNLIKTDSCCRNAYQLSGSPIQENPSSCMPKTWLKLIPAAKTHTNNERSTLFRAVTWTWDA